MPHKKRTIMLCNKEVEYTVRKHRRAKYLRLTVNCDASVILTMPRFVRMAEVETFLTQRAGWLVSRIDSLKNRAVHWCCRGTREQYLTCKEAARELIAKKVDRFNAFYNFSFQKITIKNQKTRWGSCSQRGLINFNYRLIFLEDHLIDYVVVHELCHLVELNHSRRFWGLVEKAIPDARGRRRELMGKRF